MALSGTFYTNYYNSHVRLKLSWTGTQSIANNTTTIKWTLTSNGGSTGQWWYAAPITVTIGGKTVLSTTSRFKLYGGGAYKKTGSVAITHNEDGTKSCAMSVKAAIYSTSVNCTGSKTYTLDKINRYALITSVSDFTDEGDASLDYFNADTNLATGVKARLKWLNADGVTEEYTAWSSELTAESGTVSISLNDYRNALCNACPDSNTLPVTYELQSTINGVDYTDSKTATMSIVNANPTMGAMSYNDVDPDVVAITGSTAQDPIIVQKQSTLRISFAKAEPQKGASIERYWISFNGQYGIILVGLHDDGGYFDFEKPDYAGTFVATITALDTRGNTSSSTISVNITAWQSPSAEVSLERINGFETNTVLHVKAAISAVTGSSLTIQEHHRIVNGTWTALANVSNDTDVTIALDNQFEWEMEVLVSDAFETVPYPKAVGKGIPIAFIDTDMNSIGVGCFPDDDDQLAVSNHIKIKPNSTDDVVLPHKHSDTEQIVGYWLDGSPVYERTVELASYTLINGNSYVSISSTDFSEQAFPIDVVLYNANGTGGSSNRQVWRCVIAQIDTADGSLNLYNTRSSAIGFDTFTIQYVKIPPTP